MRKSLPLSIAALLLLTACSATAPEPAQEPAQQPVSEAPVASEPMPGFDAPAEFGEVVSFPDGTEVTVTSNGSRPIVEDDMVEFEPGDVIVSFTVEVTNNSPERIESLDLSTTFAGESGTQISNPDTGAIFPGDTVEGEYERMAPGDAVEDARVTIQDPSFMGPAAIFEGSAE